MAASDDSFGAARWADIRAAAEVVLSLPIPARAAYLDRACGGDAALRAAVEAQVDACERAERSSFLGGAAADFAAPLFPEQSGRTSGTGGAFETGGTLGTGESEHRAAAAAALRGALAGRYDVERELGRGGMATVYLAHDRRHSRRIALKVLDPSLGASLSAERFLREIRLTASLTHPHVLPLHDSGEAAGQLYYVMPYVEGETLRARLARDGALPIPDATRLVRELADALAYAHAQGVVHRDLKPENVLLAGGHAVVADFGIARAVRHARETSVPDHARSALGTLTEVGVSLGTPAYMAPEQATGGEVDHRADLYALGVIAYEALAGAHPFDARTPQAMVAAQIAQAPPPLGDRRRDVPPALSALVMRLLAKDPAERPATAAAVMEALDAAVGPSPASHMAWRVALGAAVMLLVALGIAGYTMWRRPPAPGSPDARVAPAIRSVAVLPFANRSGVASDDYFSDGLTDELAHALAQLPGLRVAGRDASYAFKARHGAASDIRRALGVDAFVSATVRRAGDRVRVNPQLVSTADGTVLWDRVYESQSGDVFAVQDSVTRAIVAALAPALGAGGARTGRGPGSAEAGARRGTRDPEAYELYLKGRYKWHERGAASVTQAISYFQQAIGRDPTFARAYAALASAYDVLGVYVPDPGDSLTPLMQAAARHSLTLDSTLADAQLATAAALGRDFRFREAEAHYRAALRLEPMNQPAHQAFGFMLLSIGRTDEAIAEEREATRLDPLAKSTGTALAEALLDARRYREAENEARRILAIDSVFPLAIYSLGLAQALNGKPDSAVRTLEQGVRLYPGLFTLQGRLIFAYAAAGRWDDVRRIRAQLRRPGGDPSAGALPAFADLVLGDPAPLLRLTSTPRGLRAWFDMLRGTSRGTGCNPLADPLWSDARYRAAMRDLGMASCPQATTWPLPPRPGT